MWCLKSVWFKGGQSFIYLHMLLCRSVTLVNNCVCIKKTLQNTLTQGKRAEDLFMSFLGYFLNQVTNSFVLYKNNSTFPKKQHAVYCINLNALISLWRENFSWFILSNDKALECYSY